MIPFALILHKMQFGLFICKVLLCLYIFNPKELLCQVLFKVLFCLIRGISYFKIYTFISTFSGLVGMVFKSNEELQAIFRSPMLRLKELLKLKGQFNVCDYSCFSYRVMDSFCPLAGDQEESITGPPW